MMITLHQAGLADLDRLAPLFDAYRQFYKQAADLKGARSFLEARLAKNESVIFLALNEQEGVGFVQLYPLFSSVQMRRVWLLNDLYVTPEARRTGVGHRLMERAREFALETGAAHLELATARDNRAAQSVYVDLGYTLDTAFDHYALKV